MKLLSKHEVNSKRQFEFDLAKAICILGMVIIHCFEEFPLTESGHGGSLYYVFVTVLDAIFGAGTFMICLGVGISYTKNNNPIDFIKRGLNIFLLGYILNFLRYVVPYSIAFIEGHFLETLEYLLTFFLYTDILQFAGLAFILFGLLKKIKTPDWAIGVMALSMSLLGSFVRFIDLGNIELNEIAGLFIGTSDPSSAYNYYAPFALCNWFIIVVFGYFFGKLIKRVENTDKFYLLTLIASTIILSIYMGLAIPNKHGMMSGETINYFQMTTWEALIIMTGAIFAFSLYHFISKLFSQKAKDFVTGLSININKTYCIHWVMIGIISVPLWAFFEEGLSIYIILIIAIIIYVTSSLLAEVIKRKKDRKKELKNGK